MNTLLDFSSIEAGKLEAHFQQVNISQLTRDLSSSFRSAIESAGIFYEVNISELNHPVLVDTDMWEKIVLNLISNAFKYTESGKITVELYAQKPFLKLKVSDTGIGISEEHLDKVFERFYRINNSAGRSQEGTGIGLAMVKELVLLHKGEIDVESKAGKGSQFTVSIPVAPADHFEVMTNGNGVKINSKIHRAFIEEASKWDLQANGSDNYHEGAQLNSSSPKILIADDNGDMREYIERLLTAEYEIYSFSNGEDAFTGSQKIIPDLILTDIMMPKVDGFALLKKLKSNLATKNIPVIFLSARAGEEAKVEGIQAGADDYLVKPFSAKELLARVGNQISINRARRETEKGFFSLFLQLPAHVHMFTGPEHIVEFFHPLGKKFVGRDITGQKVREALPEFKGQGYFELLDKVYQTGETVSIPASRVIFKEENGASKEFYFSITYLPWRDANENIQGVLQFTFDVTEQTQANLKVKESEERFRILANSIPQFVWIADDRGQVEFMSEQWEEYTGVPASEGMKLFANLIHEEDVSEVRARWSESFKSLKPWTSEFRLRNIKSNEYKWFFGHTVPLQDANGRVTKWIGSASNIDQQKTANFKLEGLVAERTSELIKLNEILVQKNEELAQAQNFLQTVLDSSVELVTAFDTKLNFTFINKRLSRISDRLPEQLIGKNLLEIDPAVQKTDGYRDLIRALKGELVHIPSRRSYMDSRLVFETFLIPLKHHGEITGVVSMQRDITALVTLTEDLKASNEQLKRSNEDLQQFAHVTSHDLKEPVRKIKMYSDILSTDYVGYLPEKGKEYLTRIDKATSRISAMIDGVLQYATIDVTDQLLQRIDLNITVKNIIEDLEIPIKEFKAHVKYSDLPVMNGYPTLIHQLFYNLINNSLKFRRTDITPCIEIYAEPLTSDESNELDGFSKKIIVKDNGIGFDQLYAERIFESFIRLYSKDKYEGTGLGLALCRKIVLRHNGIIKASGELNKGAKLIMFFPDIILS